MEVVVVLVVVSFWMVRRVDGYTVHGVCGSCAVESVLILRKLAIPTIHRIIAFPQRRNHILLGFQSCFLLYPEGLFRALASKGVERALNPTTLYHLIHHPLIEYPLASSAISGISLSHLCFGFLLLLPLLQSLFDVHVVQNYGHLADVNVGRRAALGGPHGLVAATSSF